MTIICIFIFQPFPDTRAESPERRPRAESPGRRHRPSRFTGMGESRHRGRDGPSGGRGDGPSEGRDRPRSRSPFVPRVTGTEFTEVNLKINMKIL